MMKTPIGQFCEMMKWYLGTCHSAPRFDLGIGDAGKGEGTYFRRDGLRGLSVAEINDRLPFLRSANVSGVDGARRPLNIYITGAVSQPQNWLMMDDIETVDRCREIAGRRDHMIIQTSLGKHHLWLATSRPVSLDERRACQQALQRQFGGDSASVSGDHFGRLAGFKNCKRGCWVNFISSAAGGARADVDKLLAMSLPSLPLAGGVSLSQPQAVPHARGVGVPSGVRPQAASPASLSSVSLASGRDESAAEFSFALACVRKKLNAERSIQSLAERALARGKRKTLVAATQYARITFDRARAVA